MRRLAGLLHGPHLRWPGPVDAAAEGWSRLRPRVRALLVVVLVLAGAAAVDAYGRSLRSRWGGPPATVLVAARDLAVGDQADVRSVAVPRSMVPPGALARGAVTATPLALAAAEGTVLTRAHLASRGPAAGLATGMRAVPVPVEPGWGVVAGGWVDVWTLGAGDEPSRLVARGRPVLQVRDDAAGLTGLVGLSGTEVGAVTAGLAMGRVLLTHAPGPAHR